jgi:hypothetical protein
MRVADLNRFVHEVRKISGSLDQVILECVLEAGKVLSDIREREKLRGVLEE